MIEMIWSDLFMWGGLLNVVTSLKIAGKVSELSETTVVIETMAGKLKMERSAISMEMSATLNK